ncbi:hypothetical protein CPB85DRAFT_1362530, partial [Mucidula mucida]
MVSSSVPLMDQATLDAMKALLSTLKNLTVTKYTYVAAAVILMYDIFLTFGEEVSRVWGSRRSLGKWLFLVNRYVPPILFCFDLFYQLHPSPTVEFCKHAFLPPNILGIISLSIVEFILVLRTHALCRNYYILGLLTFLCISAATTMIASTVYMFNHLIVFIPKPVSVMVGCIPECTAPLCRQLLTAFWIPFFVCETLIFVLTAWKLHATLDELRGDNRYRSKLTLIIFRDGFIFYIVIMAISVANLLIWILAPISMAYLATSLMRCLQVTVCSRLLLNIRGMLEPKYGTKNFTMSSFKVRTAPTPMADPVQNDSYDVNDSG